MRRPSDVVEREPRPDASLRLMAVGIAFEVDVLVLERAPQPLDGHAAASIEMHTPAAIRALGRAALVNWPDQRVLARRVASSAVK
jgi:hypothetical protein